MNYCNLKQKFHEFHEVLIMLDKIFIELKVNCNNNIMKKDNKINKDLLNKILEFLLIKEEKDNNLLLLNNINNTNTLDNSLFQLLNQFNTLNQQLLNNTYSNFELNFSDEKIQDIKKQINEPIELLTKKLIQLNNVLSK
ncbi:hypothetical protein K502DRAFT_333252 [Neoconidiobolus thromboides FSU 785]|nr:hypothetical protein K502DRAFT_333252 [Neoconidiobolus thromboides FSU 785]